jgi:hypothetical protein
MGGFLEIAGLVRTSILAAIVLVGDILFVRSLVRDRFRVPEFVVNLRALLRMNKAAGPLLLLLVAFSTIRLLGNLEARYFHVNDDLGGYLSFPAEMLQLGTLPSDPFSERRVTSGLGGSYFLQTFTISAGDPRTARFIDWGFGSVLYLGVVIAICRKLKLSDVTILALALLTFVIPLRRTNSTMVVLPAALFGALFFLELAPDLDDLPIWTRPALMGITAGAIATLKSTYLPPAVLICALYYFGELVAKRRGSLLLQGAICALAAGFCLFPWMLDQKHKEGTYLFPVLGRGYEASAYGIVPLPSGSHALSDLPLNFWAAILPLVAPFLIAIPAGFIAQQQNVQLRWLKAATFFLAVTIATFVVALATSGDSIGRYTLPFVAPGVIVFIAHAIRWSDLLKRRRPTWLNATLAFCALWLGAVVVRYGIQEHIYQQYVTDLGLPSPSPDVMPFSVTTEKNRVAALQASVPPGQPMLEHLFVSYPLDFRRNPIFIADFPGMAGPFPGMPVGKGPELLRQYLLAQHIRFLAFSYGRGKFFDITPQFTLWQLINNPKLGGRHTWLYIQNKVGVDAQTNFDILARKYAHTYDDGEACMLDLQTPASIVRERSEIFANHQQNPGPRSRL